MPSTTAHHCPGPGLPLFLRMRASGPNNFPKEGCLVLLRDRRKVSEGPTNDFDANHRGQRIVEDKLSRLLGSQDFGGCVASAAQDRRPAFCAMRVCRKEMDTVVTQQALRAIPRRAPELARHAHGCNLHVHALLDKIRHHGAARLKLERCARDARESDAHRSTTVSEITPLPRAEPSAPETPQAYSSADSASSRRSVRTFSRICM